MFWVRPVSRFAFSSISKQIKGLSKTTFSRREFVHSAAVFSAMVIPGVGRINARPFSTLDPDDYVGRICYNENPLGPSPLALAALRDEAALTHRYPDWLNNNVENAVADNFDLNQDNVCVGAGATEMIQKVADAFLGPGDEIITATPSYTQIANEAIANGATVVYVPVDENYIIDLDGILSAITNNTTLISLVNPNNPLARIINKDDMASFLAEVPDGVVVCVDEAYHEYVQTTDYESCVPYINQGIAIVIIRTLSKAYGLAGARVGYTLASTELTDEISDTQLYATVSRTTQAAAIAGLDDFDHISDTVSLNINAKTILYTGFNDLGLQYIPSETNYIMVDTGTDAGAVRNALADSGYQVRTGWDMPQHLRVSTGTVDEMNGFLIALAAVLDLQTTVNNIQPAIFGLHTVYPNPFNSSCTIKFSTLSDEKVSLVIYDTLGRKIKTIVSGTIGIGNHTLTWDGKNVFGKPVATGIYICNLIQGEFAASKRIQLLK